MIGALVIIILLLVYCLILALYAMYELYELNKKQESSIKSLKERADASSESLKIVRNLYSDALNFKVNVRLIAFRNLDSAEKQMAQIKELLSESTDNNSKDKSIE